MLGSAVRLRFPVTFVLVGLGLVTAEACVDSDPARTAAHTCERVYRVCPGVIAASPTEAQECADMFQGRCGADLRQHIQCTVGKCDDAGAVSRAEVERACASTIDAYRRCLESDAGSGLGVADGGVDEGQLPPFVIDASPGTDAALAGDGS